jgi:hypothetical protein
VTQVHPVTEQNLVGKVTHLPAPAVLPVADSEDEGSAERAQRFQKHGVVLEVVLEIRVLDEHEVSRGMRQAGPHRVPFAGAFPAR